MRTEIETIYDEVYESVEQYLEKVRELQLLNLEAPTEEEKKKKSIAYGACTANCKGYIGKI
ncbi:hypothetical protein GCM10020331_052260 [Ectobacillus funiculus]